MAAAMGWADAPWRASDAEASALEKAWMEKKVKNDNEKVGSCGLRNEQIQLIQKVWSIVETLPAEVVGVLLFKHIFEAACVRQSQSTPGPSYCVFPSPQARLLLRNPQSCLSDAYHPQAPGGSPLFLWKGSLLRPRRGPFVESRCREAWFDARLERMALVPVYL